MARPRSGVKWRTERRPGLVASGIALPGADGDGQHVLARRDRAVVEGREGAGGVVGAVEIERVAIGAERFGFDVAAYRIAVMAGGRVAEEDGDFRLAGAGFEQAQGRERK